MLTVSTESLAVLSAALAANEHARWLLDAALAPFLLGLAFYLFVIARFDIRQLAVGRGDHWITGGALAISTLAAGTHHPRRQQPRRARGVHATLKTPRSSSGRSPSPGSRPCSPPRRCDPRLRYDVRRWSTVFPVGMYAACSFIVGAAANAPAITDFARVWVWVALALWLVVFAANAPPRPPARSRRAPATHRRPHRRVAGSQAPPSSKSSRRCRRRS